MTDSTDMIKMPIYIKVILAVLLLWSIFFLYLGYMVYTISPEQLAQAPQDLQELRELTPTWVFFSAATGAICSILGLVLMWLQKQSSSIFLLLAFIGVLIRDGWFVIFTDILEQMTTQEIITSLIPLFSYLCQWLLSLYASKKGWLR